MRENIGLDKFGERLTELLFGKDLDETAKMLGVSLSALYKWRNGKREVTLNNLVKLADCFEVSIEYLIGGSEDGRRFVPKNCPDFGKRLREVMKEKGVTTYLLRKNHRYGTRHFGKWKKGAMPYLSTVIDLANILGCTVDYLVGREL